MSKFAGVVLVMVVLIVGVVMFGIAYGTSLGASNRAYNDWLQRCTAAGGIAGLTHMHNPNTWDSDTYECFGLVDGKLAPLPGF